MTCMLFGDIFFSASHLVRNLMESKDSASTLKVKIFVIPDKVVSIYDDKVTFPCTIDQMDLFLNNNQCYIYERATISEIRSENISDINQILQNRVEYLNEQIEGQVKDLMIVVDRRRIERCNFDTIYVFRNEESKFKQLNSNGIISLHFHVSQNIETDTRVVQCHLLYGINKIFYIRFFPEYLTSGVIMRMFTKKSTSNHYDIIQKIYNDQYKHGFVVSLKDPIFEKYYKIITKYSHVTVNYYRHISVLDEDQNEHDDIKQINQCKLDKTLDIDKCSCIHYIVGALISFKEMDMKNVNKKKYDLEYLNNCYDHIICVHSFCSNFEKRKSIQTHVRQLVGECQNGQQCTSVDRHIERINERNADSLQMEQHTSTSTLEDILVMYLNSLHCYLLHDQSSRMDRIEENQTDVNVSRFTTETNDLMEEMIKFINKIDTENIFIREFNNWLTVEEYDLTSVLMDIDCNINGIKDMKQSNIYCFMVQYQKQKLFDLLYEKYVDVYNDNVNAINFGTSVLNWFEYGNEPTFYSSLYDEILNNKYSVVDDELLEEYKVKCSLKVISTSARYTFYLKEMLSLMLYTNTTALCSNFRRSFWKNTNYKMKTEFYWWATTIYQAFLYHAQPLPRLSSNCADNKGLLWSIKSTYYNPFKFIKGVDVSWISCHKSESEILVNDQYLYITKAANYANDSNVQIDHLLYQIKIFKTLIDEASFWKQIGFKVRNVHHELISCIVKHPLLLVYSDYESKEQCGFKEEHAAHKRINHLKIGRKRKTTLHRLVQELNLRNVLKQYLLLDSVNKVHFVLTQLKLCDLFAIQSDSFWKEIGLVLNESDELLLVIKQYLFMCKDDTKMNNLDILNKIIALGVSKLEAAFQLYMSEFVPIQLQVNKAFHYCCFKIVPYNKCLDYVKNTRYTSIQDTNTESLLTYDEELNVFKGESVKLFMYNKDVFGFGERVLLQEINPTDWCFNKCSNDFANELKNIGDTLIQPQFIPSSIPYAKFAVILSNKNDVKKQLKEHQIKDDNYIYEFTNSQLLGSMSMLTSTGKCEIRTRVSGCKVTAASYFPSVCSTFGVQDGTCYYEVRLLTDNIMQIGFVEKGFTPNEEYSIGVGDDEHSWAYEGVWKGIKSAGKWKMYNNVVKWKAGDIIGCYLNYDKGLIKFYINGVDFDISFINIRFKSIVFPAATLTGADNEQKRDAQSVEFIFNSDKFTYPIPDYHASSGSISFIIPYHTTSTKVSLYVKPSKNISNYTLIKSFVLQNSDKEDDTNNQIDYLLNILRLTDDKICYKQLGLCYDDDWLQVIKNKIFITNNMSNKSKINLLKRLINELHIDQLQLVLQLYLSEFVFQNIPANNIFNFCLFRLHTDQSQNALNTEYTLIMDDSEGKREEFAFKYDQDLFVTNGSSCKILISNHDVFGFEENVILQQITPKSKCFQNCSNQWANNLHIINDILISVSSLSSHDRHLIEQSKFIVIVSTTPDVKNEINLPELSSMNSYIYHITKYSNVFYFPVPYVVNGEKVSVYVRPSNEITSYRLIKTFDIMNPIRNENIETKVQYLWKILQLREDIGSKIDYDTFYIQFGLSLDDSLISMIKMQLFEKLKYNDKKLHINSQLAVNVLNKLVNMLNITKLLPSYRVYASNFAPFQEHPLFNYYSAQITISNETTVDANWFSNTQYTIVKDVDDDKENDMKIQYDEQVSIFSGESIKILISNEDLFGCDGPILLQELKPWYNMYSAQFTENLNNIHNAVIDIPRRALERNDFKKAKFILIPSNGVNSKQQFSPNELDANIHIYDQHYFNYYISLQNIISSPPQFIIPFQTGSYTVSLYVKPSERTTMYTLIKSFEIHRNLENEVDYLLNVLRLHDHPVSYQQLNLVYDDKMLSPIFAKLFVPSEIVKDATIDLLSRLIIELNMVGILSHQYDDEWAQKVKGELFKVDMYTKRQIMYKLNRLIQELSITELQHTLTVYSSEFKFVQSNNLLNCCTFRIPNMDHPEDYFIKTNYTFIEFNNAGKQCQSSINCLHELNIMRDNDLIKIMISNTDLFGLDNDVLLQEMKTNNLKYFGNCSKEFGENLYQQNGCVLLKNLSKIQQQRQQQISQYEFKVVSSEMVEENKDDTAYWFAKLEEFKIPIRDTKISFCHNILAKPRNLLNWITITSVTSSQCVCKTNKELHINSVMKVPQFNVSNDENGVIQIFSKSTIIIDKHGKVDAIGCGLTAIDTVTYKRYLTNTDNKRILQYANDSQQDHKTSSEDKTSSVDEHGGGIIEIISLKDIINNGTICASNLDASYSSGTVSILTNGKFVNNGTIIAHNLLISCSEFVNKNGVISGTNHDKIEINDKKLKLYDDDKQIVGFSAINQPWNIDKCSIQKKIQLTVSQHNQYVYHPKNLLDGRNDSFYKSKCQFPSKDWIIFEMQTDVAIKPSKLIIKNSNNITGTGIRSILVSIGDGNTFVQLCPYIIDINNKHSNEQEIIIEKKLLVSDFWLWRNGYKFIKVNILANYGSPKNMFISFSIFGIEFGPEIKRKSQPQNNVLSESSVLSKKPKQSFDIHRGGCSIFGCSCEKYQESKSKWSKGKCKSCNHKLLDHKVL
eukprot:547505_1